MFVARKGEKLKSKRIDEIQEAGLE